MATMGLVPTHLKTEGLTRNHVEIAMPASQDQLFPPEVPFLSNKVKIRSE